MIGSGVGCDSNINYQVRNNLAEQTLANRIDNLNTRQSPKTVFKLNYNPIIVAGKTD